MKSCFNRVFGLGPLFSQLRPASLDRGHGHLSSLNVADIHYFSQPLIITRGRPGCHMRFITLQNLNN
jgi:hypothetical protein